MAHPALQTPPTVRDLRAAALLIHLEVKQHVRAAVAILQHGEKTQYGMRYLSPDEELAIVERLNRVLSLLTAGAT